MLSDIKIALDSGYLIRVLVNSRKLNSKTGYVGHSIVIYDYDDTGVIIHNPGLPALPEQHVDWNILEAAWADPNVDSKEMDTIKLSANAP